jgi:hypothetical protein
MNPTRRKFIQQAAGVAFCAQIAFPGLAQSHNSGETRRLQSQASDPLAEVNAATFEAWIGSPFQVTLNRKPMGKLTLVSVTTLEPPTASALSARAAAASPAVSSFALKFSKTGAPLTQASYTLEHEWLGTFPLLLVPSGLRSAPATCTAVFSLLNPRP